MDKIILNGKNLTIEILNEIAYSNKEVTIANEAMEILVKGRKMVFDLVDKDIPVYGFNTGVGWNKDKKVFKEFFNEYNTNLIYSHSLGTGEICTEAEVRAIMAARLNGYLVGCTGISPEIANVYAEFLNKRVHPVIPKGGSVGNADLANLSHIGLAMIGEGKVIYNGEIINADKALELADIKKIELGPKDGLAIVSSNAFAAGQAALVLKELEDLMDTTDIIYSLSLEGLNGNTTPLTPEAHDVRPFSGQRMSLENITKCLNGSYIYNPDPNKPVQDPLSFRGTPQINGAVRDALKYAKDLLTIQLNSSDDNPCLLINDNKLISCANYEPISWVLAFEMLGIALSHLSKNSSYRTIKLSDPSFTKLNRFLSPNDGVLGFATIQKVFSSADAEIRHLSNPVTADFLSLAGDIEDHANNTPYVVNKLSKMVDLLYRITAVEAIHAAQAIDFRKGLKQGVGTKKAYEIIRKEVKFYDKDRPLYIDIQIAYELLKSKKILNALIK